MDATVVCIDQTNKSVQVESRAAWFPRGTLRTSNFQANETGRVYLTQSLKTVTASSPDLPNTSPPITRNISFSRYAKNSKKT